VPNRIFETRKKGADTRKGARPSLLWVGFVRGGSGGSGREADLSTALRSGRDDRILGEARVRDSRECPTCATKPHEWGAGLLLPFAKRECRGVLREPECDQDAAGGKPVSLSRKDSRSGVVRGSSLFAVNLRVLS
jgi:hypothetical protein